jgi:hypothetical protein
MMMATIPDFDLEKADPEAKMPAIGGVGKSDYDQLQNFFKF